MYLYKAQLLLVSFSFVYLEHGILSLQPHIALHAGNMSVTPITN